MPGGQEIKQTRIAPDQVAQALLGLPESRAARYMRKKHGFPSWVTHVAESITRSIFFTLGVVATIESQLFLGKEIAAWAADMPENETGSSLDELLNFAFLVGMTEVTFTAVGHSALHGLNTLVYGPHTPNEENYLSFYEQHDQMVGEHHVHARLGPDANDLDAWNAEEEYLNQIISHLLNANHLGDRPKDDLWRAVAFLLGNIGRHRPPRSANQVAVVGAAVAPRPARVSIRRRPAPAQAVVDQRQARLRRLCRQAMNVTEDQLDNHIDALRGLEGESRANFLQRVFLQHRQGLMPVMTPFAVLPEAAPRPEDEVVERVVHRARPGRAAQMQAVADPWTLPVRTGGQGLYLNRLGRDRPQRIRNLIGFDKVDQADPVLAENPTDAQREAYENALRQVQVDRDRAKRELSEESTIDDAPHQGNFSAHIFRSVRLRIERIDNDFDTQADTLATLIKRWCCHQDPRRPDVRDEFIEQLLHERAICLMGLLADSGPMHFDRWEYWVRPNKLNFAAFNKLTLKNKVRLIYTLLSGPEAAQLLALSLVQHPEMTVAAYAEFMAEFAKFSRSTFNNEHRTSEAQREVRRSLMLRHLNLLTDPSARRNSATNQPGLVQQFNQQYPDQVKELLTSYTDLLRFEELEVARECLSYTENGERKEFNAAEDKYNLLGSDFGQDLDTLAGVYDTDDVGETRELRLAAEVRMQARRREQVRQMDTDQQQAKRRLADFYWGISRPNEPNPIALELAATNPNFMFVVYSIERINAENVVLFSQSLSAMRLPKELKDLSHFNRRYIWHGLAKIVKLGNVELKNSARHFLEEHVKLLLLADSTKNFLNTVLFEQGIDRAQRNELLRLSLLAIHQPAIDVTVDNTMQHRASLALYEEMAVAKSVYDFYTDLLKDQNVAELIMNEHLETLSWLVEQRFSDCGDDASVEQVCNLLSKDNDTNHIPELIQNLNTDNKASIEYKVAAHTLGAWLSFNKVCNDEHRLHAWDYILDQIPGSDCDYELVAQLIKTHLSLDKGDRHSQIRLQTIYAALKKLADRRRDDQFEIARTLQRVQAESLLSLDEKYAFTIDILKYSQQLYEADRESSKAMVWIFTQDAHPKLDYVYNGTYGTVAAADKDRIGKCAKYLVLLLADEFTANSDGLPLRDITLDALTDRHPDLTENCPDRLHATLLAAMLNYCYENNNEDAYSRAVVFNDLFLQYITTLNSPEGLRLIPKTYPEDAETAKPADWVMSQFHSYLETYYRSESERIYNRFNNGLGNDDQTIWQSFRLSTQLIHQHYTLWRNGQNNLSLKHVLLMIYRGLMVGCHHQNLVADENRKNKAVHGAWSLLYNLFELLMSDLSNQGVPQLGAEELYSVEYIMRLILDELERGHQLAVNSANLPENCNSPPALMARLVIWLLSPARFTGDAFLRFSTTLLPRLLAQLEGNSVSAKLQRLIAYFPQGTPELITQRLVLAFAFTRWHQRQNMSWGAWFSTWRNSPAANTDARDIQNLKVLLEDGNDVSTVYTEQFMSSTQVPAKFGVWFNTLMVQDIRAVIEDGQGSTINPADDQGEGEDEGLLGGGPQSRNYGRSYCNCL